METSIFFSVMDGIIVDHFLKLLALTIITYCTTSDFGGVCDRLRSHLAVMLVSTITLFPVLLRINYGAGSHTLSVFEMPM